MDEGIALMILLVGSFVALSFILRMLLTKMHIPVLVGYIAIGFATKWLDVHYHFLEGHILHPIEFLAEAGIILLLFRVGLESNINDLIEQLPRASNIWFWNVVVSGSVGFVTSFYILGINLIPSLFVATALTATSIGVSVALWKEEKILNTKKGQLMLDVAELDDLSSIAILALLISIAPVLAGNGETLSMTSIGKTAGIFTITFVAFAAFCAFFSLKIEPRISKFVMARQTDHEPMMMIISTGFIIAALAELLGLSLTIGAFFAGLAFSRDTAMIKCEMCYKPLYEFFVPFFFIGIGLQIDPTLLSEAFTMGLILLIAAIVGKVVGTGGAAIPYVGLSGAAIIGVSMVPRAEIAMIVMQKGLTLGDWAVPQDVFAAMVVVVAGTTLLTPFALDWLLKKRITS